MLKKTLIISLALFSVLWLGSAFAQNNNQGRMNHQMGAHSMHVIPDLSDTQIEKIDALRLPHQKAMMTFRNQLAEKEARFISLTTGDKINKDEAYLVLQEISQMRLNREKTQLNHHLAVRKILNDEQRLFYDQHQIMKFRGHGNMQGYHSGMKNGHGTGYGQGIGNGHGQGMGRGQGVGNGQGAGNGQGMHDGSGPHGTYGRNTNPDCPNHSTK